MVPPGSWDEPKPSYRPAPTRGIASPQKHSILYIDAYDSFSYNVVAMLEEQLDVNVTVLTVDSEWPDGNMVQRYEAIVLGPGPGNPRVPADVGIMKDIWELDEANTLPVLGICLGFQSLCLHYGSSIERLPRPLHGHVRRISTAEKDIFEGLQDVGVTLYNSLCARMDGGKELGDSVPGELELLAWLFIGGERSRRAQIPMAVRHKRNPYWGIQFHPESCKSDGRTCTKLLKKWWEMSLHFNRAVGRKSYGKIPYNIRKDTRSLHSVSDAAATMLAWSTSTTRDSSFRSLPTNNSNPERICEVLNTQGSPAVLFQSNGRYSIISAPSPGSWRLEYYAQAGRLVLEKLGEGYERGDDAQAPEKKEQTVTEKALSVPQFWDSLRYLMEMKKVNSGNPSVPFWGGFLGYFSYEMGLACLSRPKNAPEIYGLNGHAQKPICYKHGVPVFDPPDASLLWTERSVVVDNMTGNIAIQSTREEDNLLNGWLDQTLQSLEKLSKEDTSRPGEEASDKEFLDSILRGSLIDFPDEVAYKEQVEACKAQLDAGESYELCLTCETPVVLQCPGLKSNRISFPWKLYKRLRKYNPAAFSAYAKLGDVKIISSSPECFMNWDRKSTLEMKPMKGTVRKTKEMNMQKAREILGSEKEMAENLMIADLIRHDLYGICGSGQVRVEKLLEVEDHGRVFQMITHVKGEVNYDQPGFAVKHMPQLQNTSNMSVYGLTALQRCLPPGSMTGAPKERSCMHLSSIERRKRGIYSGVMGYLDLGGGGSFSVLIRSGFTCSDDDANEQVWRVGAGGAVTTLSSAEGEWDEMLTKLRTVCTIFTPLD